MSIFRSTLVTLLALSVPIPALGQDALERLQDLAEANAEAYAGPLTRGLSYVLAGGYADRAAPLPAMGFDVGFRFLGARPGAHEETFTAVLPEGLRARDGSLETPTIAGDGEGIALECTPEYEAEHPSECDQLRPFPAGLDLPAVPMALVHATVGLGIGTDVSVNFLPSIDVAPEIGETHSRGVSARHAVSHWVASPVDVSLTGGYQEAGAGDYLEASAWHYGIVAGVQAGPMSFFGGAQMRDASTRIRYRFNAESLPEGAPSEVAFETHAESDPSYLVGARLQLLAMNLSGHYAFGTRDVFSLKLGLGMP